MRIWKNNQADLITTVVTASSQQPGLPATNLQNEHKVKVWQSGNTLQQEWITAAFPSAITAASVLLFNHNIAQREICTVQFANVADFSVIDYQSPMQWSEESLLAVFPARQFQYARVLINKADASEIINVGRLFIGDCYVCTEPPDFSGVKYSVVDLSSTQRSLGGQRYSDIRPSYRTWSFPFSDLRACQADTFAELQEENGTHTGFFLQVQDPLAGPDVQSNDDVRDEILYVVFSQLNELEITSTDETLIWKWQMDVEELL